MRYAVKIISEYNNRIFGSVSRESDKKMFFFEFNDKLKYFGIGERAYVFRPVGNWEQAGKTAPDLFRWMVDQFDKFYDYSENIPVYEESDV